MLAADTPANDGGASNNPLLQKSSLTCWGRGARSKHFDERHPKSMGGVEEEKTETMNNELYINFDEYIRQGEPQKRERAEAWRVAIGL